MGLPEDPLWILVAVLALAGLALLAFSLRALDLWGSLASFALGLVIAFAGGIAWVVLMVVFTGLGFLATLLGRQRKKALRVQEAREGERGVRNVVGNGAAAGLVALAGLLPAVPATATRLAFAAALAAVTADTMASEVGVLSRHARSILPPFSRVRIGDNGGVSLLGQGAALLGAAVIAAAARPLLGLEWGTLWIPVLAGFAGCQVDSLLGATVEGDPASPGWLGKQEVNFLASLVPAAAVLVWLALWPLP